MAILLVVQNGREATEIRRSDDTVAMYVRMISGTVTVPSRTRTGYRYALVFAFEAGCRLHSLV